MPNLVEDRGGVCRTRTVAGDVVGGVCRDCGHNNLLHPGAGNPALSYCLVCEIEHRVLDR